MPIVEKQGLVFESPEAEKRYEDLSTWFNNIFLTFLKNKMTISSPSLSSEEVEQAFQEAKNEAFISVHMAPGFAEGNPVGSGVEASVSFLGPYGDKVPTSPYRLGITLTHPYSDMINREAPPSPEDAPKQYPGG